MDKVKILNWIKSKTDSGWVFRLRSRLLLVTLYLANLDILFRMFWFERRSKQRFDDNGKLGVLSMYRPIFWHGNIFETQVNKAAARHGLSSVHILCRGVLEVCDTLFQDSNKDNNPTVCKDCVLRNRLYYSRNELQTLWLEEYVDSKEVESQRQIIASIQSIDEATRFEYAGLPVGRMVRLSVCRYFLRLGLGPDHLPVYKKFLVSAVTLHSAFTRLLEREKFSRFLIFNGRYATYNIPLAILAQKGIPYATYELSEQERFFFSVNQIAVLWHDVREKFSAWLESGPRSENIQEQVKDFVELRRKRFVSAYVDVHDAIKVDGPLDVAVFTNVVWDSAAFDRDTIFEGQFAWIEQVISWARSRPEIRVAVRIHPAETNVTYNKSDERMLTFIQRTFAELPPNVTVIPPHERKNSYGLVEQAKVVLAYSSSIGLEAALVGKPVFIAAWTHYIQKGLTHTFDSKSAYFTALEEAVRSPQGWAADKDLAARYTYWYYKKYHYLVNTDLHTKPFNLFEDSRFLRVPFVRASRSPELESLTKELLDAPPSLPALF